MTKIIGLTGGIGSGKTTVAKYFETKGIPVYIADDAAKNIMQDKSVVKQVQALFSENILLENGFLDKNAIRKLVFSDSNKLEKLNKIIHPKVQHDFELWLQKNNSAAFVIKEVAILFETNGHLKCDAVILVTAPTDVRINRVIARDNLNKEQISQIIQKQLPEEQKIKLSNFVINNEDLNKTYIIVDDLIKTLNNL